MNVDHNGYFIYRFIQLYQLLKTTVPKQENMLTFLINSDKLVDVSNVPIFDIYIYQL